MPFTSRITPEALLPRSDSRNPARTCRGITSAGRPCRRALAARSAQAETTASDPTTSSVDDTFYCWQHKDQAVTQSQQRNGHDPGGTLPPLLERTSIDTFVERLGGLDLKSRSGKPAKSARQAANNVDDLHVGYEDGADHALARRTKHKASSMGPRAARPRQQQSFWASLCCIGEEDDGDYIEIVRHKRRSEAPRWTKQVQGRIMPVSSGGQLPTLQNSTSDRPDLANHSGPPIMSYIPHSLTAQATSLLLAELTKPISSFDEPGYIYIFWLTDGAKSAPSNDDTSSLLVPPFSNENGFDQNQRRRSDVLRQYSTSKPPRRRVERTSDHSATSTSGSGAATSHSRTILLKIGRASNVHRRMSEWSRQCGYNVSLVRFYPYISTCSLRQPSPSQSPQTPPPPPLPPPLPRPASSPVRESFCPPLDDGKVIRKVPYSHRVERLVHIELAARGLRAPAGPSDVLNASGNGRCAACGREHREWFEVEASRNALKSVDEVIRKWVRWAEVSHRDESLLA
ncbi:MAG: hypothetical protein M1831_002881 [Alyxoria varia]|nr:MAG: hypothetical protein M1831_002881 [Alyxoria varia]